MAAPTLASQELIVLVNLSSSLLPMMEYNNNNDNVGGSLSSLSSSSLYSNPNSSVSTDNSSSSVGTAPACCHIFDDSPVTEEEFRYFLNGVATAFVCGLGVIGNLLSILVLTRRTMHTSTNCFLSALAIWDTLVLIIALFLVCLQALSTEFKVTAFPYVVVYLYPVALCAQTATVWLTVSFTVERYIAVCHPLKAASMCNIPRARWVILSISIVSILYNIPRWFEYRIMETNGTVVPQGTYLNDQQIYHKIYFGWLYFLVMCFIPLCTLAVLNLFLILAVRKSRQQRKDMNVRQSRENNVTIMLVFVVMTFICCQVPALIYNMAYAINKPKINNSCSWEILSHFRNFLVLLNSAVNFILYCALGQKFRRTFVRTLCPCFAQQLASGFQSFSFHPHDNQDRKNFNGNNYSKVVYKPCRKDTRNGDRSNGNRAPTSLDMKEFVRPTNSKESSGVSNGSTESPDQVSTPYQGSHKRLLVTSSK